MQRGEPGVQHFLAVEEARADVMIGHDMRVAAKPGRAGSKRTSYDGASSR